MNSLDATQPHRNASPPVEGRTLLHPRSQSLARIVLWVYEHWVLVFGVLFGVVNIAPFLAPLFMRLGWTGPANVIYTLYSLQCHLMADRTFFLFGRQPTYNIEQFPFAMTGNTATDMLALREFVGNSEMGWKVAQCSRTVFLYGTIWLAGITFGVLRQRRIIRRLSLVACALLMLPMMIDGSTHFIGEIRDGLTNSFRHQNQWLADLTGHILPNWFYIGDGWGTFNSWVRLISSVMFGIAVVWFAFPVLDQSVRETAVNLREKFGHSRPISS